jgi:predicted small secreted protein
MGYNSQTKMKTKIFVILALLAVGIAFTACEEKNSTSGHYTYYDAPAR